MKPFKVKIVTGQIDSHLNDSKYIVPGLGDYGDRFFGSIWRTGIFGGLSRVQVVGFPELTVKYAISAVNFTKINWDLQVFENFRCKSLIYGFKAWRNDQSGSEFGDYAVNFNNWKRNGG